MAQCVNINADMAEGFGAYDIGDDAGLIRVVRSANIACGFHGGDAKVMHRVCRLAAEHGVSIGAHPGFDDRWGFGRRQIRMRADDLEYMVAYQIGALQAIARYADLAVTHLKPHGALYNMAAVEADYALAIARAIKAVDPRIIYVVGPGTQMERAAQQLGLALAREGFPDRAYGDDGNLAPRGTPGAVVHDPLVAAENAVRMVCDREILTIGGLRLPIEVETLCVHGDEPTSVAVAAAMRAALEARGVAIVPLPEIGSGGTAGI